MRSKVRIDGEIGIDDITAGAADAPRVGTVAASGLTLREFGQQREIPLSTLTWWRQVFRRAGEQMNVASKRVPASDAAVFTEVPRLARAPIVPPVLEIVLRSAHVVRVPVGLSLSRDSRSPNRAYPPQMPQMGPCERHRWRRS
jgi:hypothetical protein